MIGLFMFDPGFGDTEYSQRIRKTPKKMEHRVKITYHSFLKGFLKCHHLVFWDLRTDFVEKE